MGSFLLPSKFKWWYLALSKTDNISVVFKTGAVLQHAVCNPAQIAGASQLQPSMAGPAQTCALTGLPSSASGKEGWGGQGGSLEGSPWLQHTGWRSSEINQKRAACAIRVLKAVCIRTLRTGRSYCYGASMSSSRELIALKAESRCQMKRFVWPATCDIKEVKMKSKTIV